MSSLSVVMVSSNAPRRGRFAPRPLRVGRGPLCPPTPRLLVAVGYQLFAAAPGARLHRSGQTMTDDMIDRARDILAPQ